MYLTEMYETCEPKVNVLIFIFREKDSLLDAISQFENQLAEIQDAIKHLTADREQITENYQAV